MTPSQSAIGARLYEHRILIARERFSAQLDWQSMLDYFPEDLRDRTQVVSCAPDELLAVLAADPDFDILCPCGTIVDAKVLELSAFRLIQQFGAGLDRIDVAEAARRGIWVANMPGVNAPSVAEHALLLLLATYRRLYGAAADFDPDRWGHVGGRTIAGSTVCVVGMGAIGTRIARHLVALGAHVLAIQRKPGPMPSELASAVQIESVPRALALADAVVLAASFSPGAPPILDESAFAAMKRGMVVVNVGRGGLIDERALLGALDNGTVESAGLDVFVGEPHPAISLWRHPRVVATAHVGGITDSFFAEGSRAFAESIASLDRGEVPSRVVSPASDRPELAAHFETPPT